MACCTWGGGDEVFDGAEAGADLEGSGGPLPDFEVEDHLVGGRTLLGGDVDPLEVPQRVDAPLGGLDLGLRVELRLLDLHLATDHLVAGLGVPLDLDPLDPGQRASPDGDDDVDLFVEGVDLRLRVGLHAVVAGVTVEGADGLQVLDDLGAVEPIPGVGPDHLPERPPPTERLDLLAVGVALEDPELSNFVPGPFVNREGDFDPLAVGREHDSGRADLHAHVPFVVIEGAHHEHVALEHVLAVGASGAEGEDGALPRLHHFAELALVEMFVADEGDAANGDLLVLDDLEAHHHFVVALVIEREVDVGQEVTLLGVGVLDLLNAPPHRGDAEDGVRLDPRWLR